MTHHVTFVSPQAFRGQTLHYTDAYLTPYGPAFVRPATATLFSGAFVQSRSGGLRDALSKNGTMPPGRPHPKRWVRWPKMRVPPLPPRAGRHALST